MFLNGRNNTLNQQAQNQQNQQQQNQQQPILSSCYLASRVTMK